jgi:hypothetical protein
MFVVKSDFSHYCRIGSIFFYINTLVQLNAMRHPSVESATDRFMCVKFPMFKPTTCYEIVLKAGSYILYLNVMFCC